MDAQFGDIFLISFAYQIALTQGMYRFPSRRERVTPGMKERTDLY
jgi:hypothetical protein